MEGICLLAEEIKNEFKDLIVDPGTSRGRISLSQKYLELQWSDMEKDEHHGEILLQWDKIILILHRILDNQAEFARRLGIKLEPHEQLFD